MTRSKFKKIINVKGVFGVWKSVFGLIASNPKILLPFVVLSAMEMAAVWILSCSPHFPVNKILAPPIRSIWGDIYLHYPFIYELLPRIFYYAKIILGIFIGSVASGVVVLMTASFRTGRKIELKEALMLVLRRYLTLIVLSVILFASVHYVMKQPTFLFLKYFSSRSELLSIGPKFWFTIFMPVLTFVMAVVLQGLFIYSIPYVVLKGKKFLSALFLGFRLFFLNLIRTLLVVVMPMVLYIPVTMLRGNLSFIADKFSPEGVIAVLLFGIVVGTLIVDSLLTIATTFIFMEATRDEK